MKVLKGRFGLLTALALISLAVLLSGCTSLLCPSSCDDGKPCTRDHCGTDTLFACAHDPLDGGQPGCSEMIGSCRRFECVHGSCEDITLASCCGNGNCESSENIDSCPADCRLNVTLQCTYPSDIVPAFAKWGIVTNSSLIYCNVTNTATIPFDITLSAEIIGFTQKESRSIALAPGETKRNVGIAFSSFTDRFYSNDEVTDATLQISAERRNTTINTDTASVRIHARDDIIWSVNEEFDMAPLIAMWVTPHDPCVDQVLTIAKEKMPGRSLTGYLTGATLDEQLANTRLHSKAIFQAIKDLGVSYVNTPVSFAPGNSQRINFPYESVEGRSGNCIDGAVLFASAFESLGMEPIIVIIPGHAYVGVRVMPNDTTSIFIETTMVGTGTYEQAEESARQTFLEHYNASDARYYYLSQYREQGITPFPPAGHTTCNVTRIPCSDGTISGACSASRPYLCQAGALVERASTCGCAADSYAVGDRCEKREVKIYDETFSIPTGYFHYYGGDMDNSGEAAAMRYVVTSDYPVEIHVVPTERDYDKYRDGEQFVHYPGCYSPSVLSYDKDCNVDNRGGIVIRNEDYPPATVHMTVYERRA